MSNENQDGNILKHKPEANYLVGQHTAHHYCQNLYSKSTSSTQFIKTLTVPNPSTFRRTQNSEGLRPVVAPICLTQGQAFQSNPSSINLVLSDVGEEDMGR